MKNLFDEKGSQEFVAKSGNTFPELALRVYTSRLLGQDSSLVLHGGGNTSVKLRLQNLVGEDMEVIFVKGSGADLATIGPSGFVGLELEPLRKLAYNLHWDWNVETKDLFRRLDRKLWESTRHNPVLMLGMISQARLEEVAEDDGFLAQMERASP